MKKKKNLLKLNVRVGENCLALVTLVLINFQSSIYLRNTDAMPLKLRNIGYWLVSFVKFVTASL